MTILEQWALKGAALCIVVFVEVRTVEHIIKRFEVRYWRAFTGPRETRR